MGECIVCFVPVVKAWCLKLEGGSVTDSVSHGSNVLNRATEVYLDSVVKVAVLFVVALEP